MPPEYLTKAEALKMQADMADEFKDFRSEILSEVKDVREKHDKLKGDFATSQIENALVGQAIKDIKQMLADKTQMRLVIISLIVTNLVTIGTAVWAAK